MYSIIILFVFCYICQSATFITTKNPIFIPKIQKMQTHITDTFPTLSKNLKIISNTIIISTKSKKKVYKKNGYKSHPTITTNPNLRHPTIILQPLPIPPSTSNLPKTTIIIHRNNKPKTINNR